jgi:hypothetical protein
MFWSEWAAFGHTYKGESKCLKILTKGIESGEVREGLSVLVDMKSAIQGGRFGGGGGIGGEGHKDAAAPPSAAAPTPRLRQGPLVEHTHAHTHVSAPPPFQTGEYSDATETIGTGAVDRHNPRPAAEDDVTMEICGDAAERRAMGGIGAAAAPVRDRYAPLAMEEDATVAVPPTMERHISASAAMTHQRQPAATAPASSTAAAHAAAHAASHAAASASAAADQAALKAQAEEKKKRPKIRENSEMVVVRGVKYLKLECVGTGGTCKVYKVLCPKRYGRRGFPIS